MTKHIELSTREKVKRLKSLITDAIKLNFNQNLIKKFQKQLETQEGIIESDKAKRKAQQLKERKAQQRDKE